MSIYHSHPQRRQGYKSTPLTEAVSPVTNQELADWLRLDDDTDPILAGILTTVTGYTIERLQSELINRQRKTIYENWPVIGTTGDWQISLSEARRQQEIVLPYARLQSIELVELYGDTFTSYIEQDTSPAQIFIEASTLTSDGAQPAILLEYTAGFGATAADVPEAIKTGIKMMAASMYEHRGQCSVADAWASSGAGMIMQPYSLAPVVM